MTNFTPHLSSFEGMQATLSVPRPKDPPNTPVPRLVHSVSAPDADQLKQLLVKVIGRVQAVEESGEAVCSVLSRSSSASSESMVFVNNASIAIRHG